MFVVHFSGEGAELGGRGEGGLYLSFCVSNLWLEKDRYVYLSKKKKQKPLGTRIWYCFCSLWL